VNIVWVMLKKELRGNIRTHKLLIVVAIFFVLGLGTPLIFNYLHVLIPSGENGIVIPEFTTADVIGEYFSTLGQFGLVAVILVAMGSVSREREGGTAAMILSKPVGAGAFILAKIIAISIIFLAAIIVGATGCYIYTAILFEDIGILDFFLANSIIGVYFVICTAVTVMYSSFFKNQLAAGALALITLIVLTAISAIPAFEDFVPGSLTSWAHRVAMGTGSNAYGALATSIGLVMVAYAIGLKVFKTKEL